jgi:membrane protein implicated in regulation of membrane protease activity
MLDTIFLVAAVMGGTIMVCQFVLTLMGMGGHGADAGGDFHGDMTGDFHGDVGDVSGDFHGDAGGDVPDADMAGVHHTSVGAAAEADYQHPDSSWLFGVLSFRTLVAAAAFFGVTGKAALSAGYAQSTSLIIAMIVGFAAMYGMYMLMRSISQLSCSGTERIHNALGRQATVYVPIPAARQGLGKVQLSMQNRIVEYQAVTDDAQPLKTGEEVEVVDITGSDIVKVRRVPETVEA